MVRKIVWCELGFRGLVLVLVTTLKDVHMVEIVKNIII